MLSKMLALALFCATTIAASGDALPVDGAGVPFNDSLLDKMVGHWTLKGTLVGRPATHSVDVQWTLNHQFLQIHEVGTGYEAMPMIGFDHMSERYVAHWIDIFGGRFSETLGYGRLNGNEIDFVFEYPDGPFHTRFIWDAALGQWRWEMSQKNEAGKWTPFADLTLTKS
jgi:hypothetical protein